MPVYNVRTQECQGYIYRHYAVTATSEDNACDLVENGDVEPHHSCCEDYFVHDEEITDVEEDTNA